MMEDPSGKVTQSLPTTSSTLEANQKQFFAASELGNYVTRLVTNDTQNITVSSITKFSVH